VCGEEKKERGQGGPFGLVPIWHGVDPAARRVNQVGGFDKDRERMGKCRHISTFDTVGMKTSMIVGSCGRHVHEANAMLCSEAPKCGHVARLLEAGRDHVVFSLD
jgi:hypothetical protein